MASDGHVTSVHKTRDRVTRLTTSNHTLNHTNDWLYAHELMSSTKLVVRNAAAALKKATDPWSKEDRVTADRVASAAISVVILDWWPCEKAVET